MNNGKHQPISPLHTPELQAEMALAARKALWLHKAMNVPVSSMKDGKLVIIQPEDIPVYENPFPKVQLGDPAPAYPPLSVPFTENL